MKVLLDTNIFLWVFGGRKLSDKAREYFENSDEKIRFFVSHVTAWELSIKYGLGKLRLPQRPEVFFPERMRRAGFAYLGIDLPHVLGVHSLPQIHRDPFDRLLVSQAGIEDMAVCSSDPIFQSYDVEVVDLRDVS